MTMRRWLPAACVVLAGAISGCQAPPPPQVIGHVAPFTGAEKDAAEQAANGIKLALDDYTAADKSGRPFAVRHADDRGDPTAAEGQAIRLVKLNHAVALLGGLDPAEVSRLDHTEAPLIAPIGYRDPTLSDLVLTTGPSPARRAAAIAKLVKDFPTAPKSLVLVVEPGDESKQTEAALVAQGDLWKSAARVELGDPASDDVKSWAKSLDKNALPVLIASSGIAKALLLETALKDRPVIYAGPEIARRPLHGRTAPVYLTTAFAGPKADEFAKKYQDKFGAAAEPQAAAAYDDAMLAFEMCKRGPMLLIRPREEIKSLKETTGLGGAAKIADGVVERPVFAGRLEKGAFFEGAK